MITNQLRGYLHRDWFPPRDRTVRSEGPEPDRGLPRRARGTVLTVLRRGPPEGEGREFRMCLLMFKKRECGGNILEIYGIYIYIWIYIYIYGIYIYIYGIYNIYMGYIYNMGYIYIYIWDIYIYMGYIYIYIWDIYIYGIYIYIWDIYIYIYGIYIYILEIYGIYMENIWLKYMERSISWEIYGGNLDLTWLNPYSNGRGDYHQHHSVMVIHPMKNPNIPWDFMKIPWKTHFPGSRSIFTNDMDDHDFWRWKAMFLTVCCSFSSRFTSVRERLGRQP